MGKMQKKGEAGAAVNYITRSSAVKKLQLSLANFRRLCILKGVYPREPSNKKKAGKGSTAPKTFYYRKDIQYLLHEPILATMRAQKIHKRKLKTASKKLEWGTVSSLEQSMPEYRLDHVIRERYPAFVDALRDLDDALAMVFLFATLPVEDRIRGPQVRECQRLSSEFLAYVVEARCLRKTFLSVKGVYYQAEILGQDITWIVPYKFAQLLPVDVDFKVMGTFLELYITLLTFVNYKLYADRGLAYPPRIDSERDDQDCGITAFVLEHTDKVKLVKKQRVSKQKRETVEKRLASLGDNMETLQEDVEDDEQTAPVEEMAEMEQDEQSDNEQVDALVSFAEMKKNSNLIASHTSLFAGCVFFLNRETPRWSLEFVIRSFGGVVGWEDDSTRNLNTSNRSDVSEYTSTDTRITHHIIDRPTFQKLSDRREYIQPQWVYDSVNQKRIIPSAAYQPGTVLPPHLSPFVKYEEGDYKPDGVDEQKADQEMADAPPADSEDEDVEVVKQRKESEVASEKERALFMMSKKDRRLYTQIEFGKKRKDGAVDLLKAKKQQLQQE